MAEGGGGSVPDHDLRRRFEGQLSKFTNVVKGWQFRYTVSVGDPQIWFKCGSGSEPSFGSGFNFPAGEILFFSFENAIFLNPRAP
jgi:hypothetical protein